MDDAFGGNFPPPGHDPLLLSPRSYNRYLNPVVLELWPGTSSFIPDEEVTNQRGDANDIRGATLRPQSEGEPPLKKRRIECVPCDKTFTQYKSLYRHLSRSKAHQAESIHRCDECGQDFTRVDSLQRHVSKLHGGQGSGMLRELGSDTQQGPTHDAQEFQGGQPPHTADITSICIWDDSLITFAPQDPTEGHTDAVSYSDTETTVAPQLATSEHQTGEEPYTLTTPAAAVDLLSFDDVAFWSEDYWNLDHSIASLHETSISVASNEVAPASSTQSLASRDQEVTHTAGCETDDDADLTSLAASAALAAALEQKLTLFDVPYASAKPVSQGRNLRPRRIQNPMPCPLCGYELGHGLDDKGEVATHLEKHLKRMADIQLNAVSDSEATCTDCQIHFLDTRDLARHQRTVETGRTCGFTFVHREGDCTGHHPRMIGNRTNFDHHYFELSLRHWEFLQRVAFRQYVEAYSKGMAPTNAPPIDSGTPPYRMSTGSIYSELSRQSFTAASFTPARFNYDEWVDPLPMRTLWGRAKAFAKKKLKSS